MRTLEKDLSLVDGKIEQKCTGFGNGGNGCGSTLLISENDVLVTADFNFDGDLERYYSFKCPICGALTDIHFSKVPLELQKKEISFYKPHNTSG